MSSIQNKLLQIQESQSFDELNEFSKPALWETMTADERTLLAELLTLQGVNQLKNGDLKVLESFRAASDVSRNSPQILLKHGQAFAGYPDNFRCLMYSHVAFQFALEGNPHLFDALYGDAISLIDIGLFEGDVRYFYEANEQFEKSFPLLVEKNEHFDLSLYYWKWATCLSLIGRIAGEPHDFNKSLEKYRIAYNEGLSSTEFLNDYGDAYAEFGSYLTNLDYFVEALKLFNTAVEKDPGCYRSWFNQACCLQRLNEPPGDDDVYQEAYHSFKKAAELNADHFTLWLKWGQLVNAQGKYERDVAKIEEAVEKFAKANELESNQPNLLYFWAESLLFLGSQQERLDLIQLGKEKILKCIEIQPDTADAWYLYGICLIELGHYFEEESYYHQALEKFQYGLSLDSKNPLLWYGMALSHFALGEKKNEEAYLEKAIRYCAKVIECGGSAIPQFWNDWGVALMKYGEMTGEVCFIEKAIEKFEKAVKHPAVDFDSNNADLEWIYHYGCAFDLLGDLTGNHEYFEKSIQILNQVIDVDPQDPHARYNLALAYFHLGDATADVESYHKALEHFEYLSADNHEDEMLHVDYALTLISLGQLIQDEHHSDEFHHLYRFAENHLIQAISLGSQQANYHLAGIHSLKGHFDQAMHFLEKAQFKGALPPVEELLHDDWLEGLRKTPAFRQFLDGLSSQQS